MGFSINKVFLVGNLGTSAEVTYTRNGRPRVKFPLATNRSYKTQAGDRVEETTWHKIVMWGERAKQLAPRLVKGTRVAIDGRIENRRYGENDEQFISEVIVHDLVFGSPAEPQQDEDEKRWSGISNGDIPF